MNALWEEEHELFTGFDEEFSDANEVAKRLGAVFSPWEKKILGKQAQIATFLDGSYIFISEDGKHIQQEVDDEAAGKALEDF
jgi:hypothetical protein